ncbi:de-hypoxanthine futalosine cyclase [Thermodesulfitimonas autotrophica]|uniref:Aminodeoxyfutalosine synthase n=1 Tax=Thermodesulfitimonas autotrophica TaxID=1894989 RepID=A0A3N5AWI5_9THEO|nr:aminofutalosine synthase MqnE [Thermodesulfitimonas autotrophica]RPF49379.1 de-hypoxanthine futalosine cyclase [Thermodesulfitimonas autotrophica]
MAEIWQLDGALQEIAGKVAAGERLDREDALTLYRSNDLLALGYLSAVVKKRRHGERVYFAVNHHLNYSNVCVNGCRFCAFSRAPGEAGAYTLSLDAVEAKLFRMKELGVRELHIVGGLNPELDLGYFEKLLRRAREILPGVTLKALTAVEVDFLARRHGLSITEVLSRLKEAGLDCLPGGGAEVFAPRVRELICPRKISGDKWLAIHAAAHRLGIPTNATLLYGHLETVAERVDHLLALRRLQDETGGFLSFVPLAFHPRNTALAGQVKECPTGFDDLKTIAIARLLLDNFPHVKAYWVMLGPKIAQIALHFGADDLEGTVVEEKITHSAGAESPEWLARQELVELIRTAGYVPVERDALYNTVREGF